MRCSTQFRQLKTPLTWKAVAMFGLWSMISLAIAQPETATQPSEAAAQPPTVKQSLAISAEDIVVPEGLITKYQDRERVSALTAFRRPMQARNVSPEMVKTMDDADFKKFVAELAIDEVLFDTAIKKNFLEQDEELKARVEEMKERVLIYLYYQKSPAANVKVTEEEMQAYYDENKKQYYRPYQFSMRHIFLSTYVPYTAKEGDTLEALAESISKDKELVKFILSDDTQKEARWVPPDEREEKLFKPLQPGEKLLVPMAKEDKDKVRARMAEIKKMLDEGADFETLAQEHSETEQKGVKIGPLRPESEEERGKPILPEILQAIEKTEPGKVTDIVQTKHGFQIYKVEDKEPARTLPFADVKTSIESVLTRQKSEDAINTMYMDLAKKAMGDLKINRELLKAADPSPAEVLVSSEDGLSVNMQALTSQIPDYKDSIKTDDDLLGALIKLRPFNTWLLKKAAIAEGIMESEEYKSALREVSISLVAPAYVNHVVSTSIEVSDSELKKYYDENPDPYKIPEQVDLYLIGRKISEDFSKLDDKARETAIDEALAALGEKVKDVKTLDDFKKLAGEISEDASKSKNGSLGPVPTSYRNGFNGMLEKLEAGKMSAPVAYGTFVYVLWIKERMPESIRPFEEVRDQVEMNYRNSKAQELLEQLRAMVIVRAGLDDAFGATAARTQAIGNRGM